MLPLYFSSSVFPTPECYPGTRNVEEQEEDKEGGKQLKYSTQAGYSRAALEITVQSDLQCPSVNLKLLTTLDSLD